MRERAVLACRSALADYQAGLLDESELRRELGRAGIVFDERGAWLLDIDRGRWHQYQPVPTDRVLDGDTVRRWRAGLGALLSQPTADQGIGAST